MQFQQRGMWEKNLRLPIRQFERKISSLDMELFFFHFFFCRTSPYLQYAPAIPVCSILQPCVSARQKSECRGLLDPRNTWTCTNDAWAYWIQIDRRKSTIHERSVRTERQEGLLTDRLTIKSNSWSLIEGVSAESGENGKNEVQGSQGERKKKLRLTGKAFFQKACSKLIRNVGQPVRSTGTTACMHNNNY